MSENTCGSCKKPGAEKRCAKCKTQHYCSRDCQKVDWKIHKKVCDRGSSASSDTSPPQAPPASSSTSPFQVHNITDPESLRRDIADDALSQYSIDEVYKRLIDSYRLRVEDDYVFRGDTHGLYAEQDPLRDFKRFLNLAEKRGNILPPWWNKEKRTACEKLGRYTKGWSSLAFAIEKHDVQEEYKDPLMPMKLRVLAERIYGFNVMSI